MWVTLAPAPGVLGQLGFDLGKGAALEVAKAAFAQPRLGHQRRARGAGHRLGGGVGPLEVAGVDGANRLTTQGLAQLGCLPQTGVVQWNVEVTLYAGVHVPGGFAMAYGNDAGGLHAGGGRWSS
ncbi:hypothetical protein D3C71_1755820 [compost metagenome]